MLIPFQGKSPKIDDSVFIAPSADIIGDVTILEQSSVWFGCILRGDIHYIKIGKQTNVQDGTIFHVTQGRFPVEVGNRVSIAHGCMIHGCTIEHDCLIGMSAKILDGAMVGHHSIIAAGALVTEGMEVPPYSVVMGVPGKVVRRITDKELERVEANWQAYLKYSREWREN